MAGVATCETPLGELVVWARESRLVRIEWGPNARKALSRPGTGLSVTDAYAEKACLQIGEYFTGLRSEFDLQVDLTEVPPFQARALRALREVHFGETCTYGELAAAAGSPNAARAAGSACAKNRLPLVIPCHRVVAGNGLGGFGPGLDQKRFLLGHERRAAPSLRSRPS